jgi:glutamyl-tRNA synthetase
MDDAITRVIRGRDVSNTPKQLQILAALGQAVVCPRAGLLGDDGKLSKRHGATSIDEFRSSGLHPRR